MTLFKTQQPQGTLENWTYEELQQRISVLEATNEKLNQFASIVSHDLKAPLRGVVTLVKIIREDMESRMDEESTANFALLEKRVERMRQMIISILEYCAADITDIEYDDVDTNSLVCEIIDLLVVPEHVNISIDSQLPVVKASAIRLQQVFQNLISNAIKFNDKTECRISINHWQDGNIHHFSVSDNGTGIEPRFFDKIFKMFQTLQSKDISESTGVGLSIVQRIVTNAGGKVSVESEPGIGSKFTFTWPEP